MSDWRRISDALAQKLNYTNTFYHAEPKLDIVHLDESYLGRFDFVISSEVFEHIEPPVSTAFNNLARLLKPDGFIVFSVPWIPDEHTREHFPDLHDWHLEERDGRQVLINRTEGSALQVYDQLIFHGGPGQTLEMRLFSQRDLIAHLSKAGLEYVKFADIEENLEHGIIFEPWSRGLTARPDPARRHSIQG